MSSQNPAERRKCPRYQVALDCMVSLLIPHQTFTPHAIRGVTVDLSHEGMRLKTYSLGKADFLELLRGMSHVKIEIADPYHDHPIHLRGQVVWADYHDKTERDNAHCFLGISFYEFTEQARREFHEVMGNITRATTSIQKLSGVKLR
jgi:hypothetical protein